MKRVINNKIGCVLLIAVIFIGSSFSPKKANILIIGDSISIGYTPFVEQDLKEVALVKHNPGNAQHTGTGLKKVEAWIGDTDWDIIQFNWGLWDLCYRHPDAKVYGNRDKLNGKITHTVKEYRANLEALVLKLKELSDAKLIFVTTSYVPKEEAGRFSEDALVYNQVAKAVMQKHDVLVNDVYEKSRSIHKNYGQGENDVHYTKEGYKKLGKTISKFLLVELKRIIKNR